MNQSTTLATRLTMGLMIWVCLLWALSAAGVAVYVHYEIDEAFDRALMEAALQLDKAAQLAESRAHRIDAFYETMYWLVLPMLAFLPLLAFIVQRTVKSELKPVQQLTTQMGDRGGQNLTALSAEDGFPSELVVIVESTNRLLERMGVALDIERSLAANAAHELRTPIGTARLRIDNALQYPLPDLAKTELQAAVMGLDQLSRRAEKLLQLSRAEGSQSLNTEPVDLAYLASLMVQEFWANADARARLRLTIPECYGAKPALIQGDMDTLALVLRNLIENALSHAPFSLVEVRMDSPTSLRVLDHGVGVSKDDIAMLTQRHIRKTKNQTGFGLGLSIVKTIVERHKGTLTLSSPPAGLMQGFEARIDLVGI